MLQSGITAGQKRQEKSSEYALYTMGDEADDILQSFDITEEDRREIQCSEEDI